MAQDENKQIAEELGNRDEFDVEQFRPGIRDSNKGTFDQIQRTLASVMRRTGKDEGVKIPSAAPELASLTMTREASEEVS